MMKFMRHGFFSFIFLAMLVLAGFSLVLTDWTGSFRSGVGSHDVAKMEGEKIGQVEFARLVERTLRAENIRPDQAYQIGLINRILTSEIWQRMLSRAAYGYGLAVGDEALLARLAAMAAPVATEQKTTPAAVIKRFIEAQGVSEPEFLAGFRRETTTTLLRDVVGAGAAPSRLMLHGLYAAAHQTRAIDYLVFLDDDVPGIVPPSDVALETYYKTRQNEFLLPERRDFRIATITRAAIQSSVTVSEADAKAFYEAHKDQMTRPDTKNITVSTYKTKADADARAHATRTDTNDFAMDDSLPDYLSDIREAAIGTETPPTQTPLGWITAKVNKMTPGGAEPFDQAKKKIIAQLTEDRLSDAMDTRLETLDQAHERRTPFDTVVQSNSMTAKEFKNIARDGMNDQDADAFRDLGALKARALPAAFDMTETGQVSPPIEMSNGDIAVVVVDRITPARPKDLAQVRERLIKDWMASERKRANVMALQMTLNDLTAGKTSLAAIAKEKGRALVQLATAQKSQEKLPDFIDRAAWTRLFDAEIGKPIFQTLPNGVLLAVVHGATLADPAQSKDDAMKSLGDDTARAMKDEQLVQYLGALNDRYNAKVNDRLLQQMYGPKKSAE